MKTSLRHVGFSSLLTLPYLSNRQAIMANPVPQVQLVGQSILLDTPGPSSLQRRRLALRQATSFSTLSGSTSGIGDTFSVDSSSVSLSSPSSSRPTSSLPFSEPTLSSSSSSSSSSSYLLSSSVLSLSTPSSTPPPSSSSSPIPSPSSSITTTSTDTTLTSAVITSNSQVVTVAIPTTLNGQGNNAVSSRKTAIIAGSVVGGVIFILLLVLLCFLYRRHQARKRGFFQSSETRPRTLLLQGEDVNEDHGYPSSAVPPIMRYTDYPVHGRGPSTDSGPRLMRPRASDSGSIFHEGVWPPPGERSKLVDPILASSDINLSTIIDDVMGDPSDTARGASRLRGGDTANISNTSSWADGPPVSGFGGHNRDISTTSETGLLPPPYPSYLSQPFDDSPTLPSLLLPSRMQAASSRSTTSIPSTLGSSAGPKNWLDRSPRKNGSPSRPNTHLPRLATPPEPRSAGSKFP